MTVHTTAQQVASQIRKADTKGSGIDATKYFCVSSDDYHMDDFTPPSAWCVLMATGDFMYLKARDRKKAQELCDIWFGVGKYIVRSDKKVQIR